MKRSLLAGLGAAVLGAVLALPAAPANASPKAAVSPEAIAASAPVAYTRWRGHRRYGWGYRRYRYGYNPAGAAVAGAALGLFAAAATRPYYDDYYYGGYYPAYSYGYAYPSYGYAYPYWGGYRRAWYPRSYGYYGGWRRAGWGYGGGPYGARWRAGAWR
ncbi:MAG TPA: hypothetical protein VF601_04000 [Beijerinckiaceae bacterium]|jgi:hypothetical protein